MELKIYEYIVRRTLRVLGLLIDLTLRSNIKVGSERIRLTNPMRLRYFFEQAGGYLLFFGRKIAQKNILSERYQNELQSLLNESSYDFVLRELSHLSFAHMRLRVDLALLQMISLLVLLTGNRKMFSFLSSFINEQQFFLDGNIVR